MHNNDTQSRDEAVEPGAVEGSPAAGDLARLQDRVAELETLNAALQETVERVRKSVETRSSADSASLVKEAKQCAFRLKRSRLLQSETELRFLLREAEEVGDAATRRPLQHQVIMVTRELRTIDSAIRLHG